MANFISFSNYRRHAETYGYISTWCAWDEERKIGSEFVTAHTEEEYRRKGLDRTLHADVVVLGLNFGASPGWVERTGGEDSAQRLAILRAKEPFGNMYAPMRPRYAPFFRGTCLWGGYATDFFKFEEGQRADELPVGIPTKDGGGIADRYFEPDAVKLQVDGIKRELQLLGCGDTNPNFVLASRTLLHPAVLDGLSTGFPGMKHARINHYQHANSRLLREALAVQVPAAHAAFTGHDTSVDAH